MEDGGLDSDGYQVRMADAPTLVNVATLNRSATRDPKLARSGEMQELKHEQHHPSLVDAMTLVATLVWSRQGTRDPSWCIGIPLDLGKANLVCLAGLLCKLTPLFVFLQPLGLIDDDHAQCTALHGLLVFVTQGAHVLVDGRKAAPVVDCVPIDLCCHCVLKR